ncbi:MAG: hypothetical protein PHD21_06790 [Flavobacteriales bacterium]|nr:hypothetical protein [Flavobacteriales bacterium]
MALSDKEIEKLRQYHHAMSERIRQATVDTLHQESEQEKQKRIAHLLRPENYDGIVNFVRT